ncbi:hypothetical protein BN1723_016599 [Verticillium longisporum]|uniref:protein disulfide-isomerase n=1 Tax=Verticillium longisporum TaxID=100787 RepID=A0A0G4NHC9_VERLO|nr:hypothetical protein BN1723_016599 [Verticillium longisporum]
MRSHVSLAACLALATHGVLSWEFLSEADTRQALDGNEFSLVAFVSPEDEASKNFEPEWLPLESQEFALSVDCQSAARLCAELDVVSLPAIRIYTPEGLHWRYRGPRVTKEIMAFLQRMFHPPVTEFDGPLTQSFAQGDDVVFMAQVGSGPENDNIFERYIDLADEYRDRYSFGLRRTDDATSNIRCFQNVDRLVHITSELETVEAMGAFLKKCTAFLIPEMTRQNEMDILSSGKSVVYFASPSAADREAHREATRPLAQKYNEYLVFVTVDSSAHPDMMAGLGLDGGASAKGLSVQNPRMGQVFPFAGSDSEYAQEILEKFIVAISEGKVEPWSGAGAKGGDTADAASDGVAGGEAPREEQSRDEL